MVSERVLKDAATHYTEVMDEYAASFPVDVSDLFDAHQKGLNEYMPSISQYYSATEEAISVLKKEAVNFPGYWHFFGLLLTCGSSLEQVVNTFQKQSEVWKKVPIVVDGMLVMKEQLTGGLLFGYWDNNYELAHKACKKELKSLYSVIQSKIERSEYNSISEFEQDMKNMKTQYKQNSKVSSINDDHTEWE